MLKIENLHAEVEGKAILKGLNLNVKPGEIHAIMGPNGAGKSTLASVIAGKEDYEVTQGIIELDGEDISELDPTKERMQVSSCRFNIRLKFPSYSHQFY